MASNREEELESRNAPVARTFYLLCLCKSTLLNSTFLLSGIFIKIAHGLQSHTGLALESYLTTN